MIHPTHPTRTPHTFPQQGPKVLRLESCGLPSPVSGPEVSASRMQEQKERYQKSKAWRANTNHPLMGSKVGSKVGILWFALARRRRLRIQNSKMNHFFGIHLRSLSSYVGTTALQICSSTWPTSTHSNTVPTTDL